MTALLYRLGHFCVRRHRSALAVWLVTVVGLVAVTQVIGKPTNDNLTLPGTGSTEATDLLAEKLPKQQNGTVPIVLETSSGRLDSGANRRAVEATVKSLARPRGWRRRSALSPARARARSPRTARSATSR